MSRIPPAVPHGGIEVPEFKQPMMRPSATIMVRALPTERFMKSHGLSWITGRHVDARAPPLRAYIPSGYPEHFQASYVVFPMHGCLEIVAASIGLQSLTIVLAVEFIASGPKSRLNGPPRGWRPTGG
jgi:hypothetical protein